MEDEQIRKYPFFQRLGAFSISRNDRKKAITSLRYAVESLERKHSSLFIYPEGTITPIGSSMKFEGGLAWLHSELDDVDFVPVAIHIHTIRHDKPELHLHIGRPIRPKNSLTKKEKTIRFEKVLNKMLDDLRALAGFDDSDFERFL